MSCPELGNPAIKPTWQNRTCQHNKMAISNATSKTMIFNWDASRSLEGYNFV
jgi:hypothetical protein